ncbi:class I SAM-dependent DNA methyltransferase [Janthinobacterium fluminis]|uniref:Class I SAM-dependent methyltransferase n=1 Tax=Janthinobacterium fluminis TaxID=2987524 RepID=A0ABT5K318_9BURK|nr:class I SAM-dependent methyltransferase [Janthinobacterium fluminis]MDC8759378.1 class I SAM-dependent methyltransferase [Janthinobacterium fluminis]
MQSIHDYYDKLAQDYDSKRFGNSYGRYLDRQERDILSAWLAAVPPEAAIDLGCGTGRLLDFAMTGADASAEMLKVAAAKFPDRRLIQASLPDLGVAGDSRYRAATCFHVFMHLDKTVIEQSLRAVAGIVAAGGIFILDIPSQHRRALNWRKPSGWHGGTAATRADIAAWAGPAWRIVGRRGILFFPIHRLPAFARPLLRRLDALIGRSPLGRYASYHVYQLERQA